MTEIERRQQILQAALRVFAERGFHKATIKQIAQEAQLKSPALIYWYFESKEQLLQAVMLELTPFVGQVTSPAELMERPPREVLTLFAENMVRLLDHPDVMRLMRIFFSEAIRDSDMANTMIHLGPALVVNFFTTYLQHQIDVGRLRPHDPRSSARAFIGMLVFYMMSNAIFTALKSDMPEREPYVRDIVDLFLRGLER